MSTLLHLQGGFPPPPLDLSWVVVDRVTPKVRLPRKGALNKRPWAPATGSRKSREEQAAHYLRGFDLETAGIFDSEDLTLLKVVCNLRNYYGMDKDTTILLVADVFNPRLICSRSNEGVALAWEEVAGYTPSLGLSHIKAVREQRRNEVDDAVADLLAYTRPGSRVEVNALLAVLNEWNPDLHANSTELGRSLNRIASIDSTPSKGKSYYSGIRLPSPEEVPGALREAGLDFSHIQAPRRPERPVDDLPTLKDAPEGAVEAPANVVPLLPEAVLAPDAAAS